MQIKARVCRSAQCRCMASSVFTNTYPTTIQWALFRPNQSYLTSTSQTNSTVTFTAVGSLHPDVEREQCRPRRGLRRGDHTRQPGHHGDGDEVQPELDLVGPAARLFVIERATNFPVTSWSSALFRFGSKRQFPIVYGQAFFRIREQRKTPNELLDESLLLRANEQHGDEGLVPHSWMVLP